MLSCSIWFSAPSFWIGGAVHHPHRTHDLRSGSQDHHPSKNSVQKTICCNSTSNAPDDRRMYPKHVELRIHQWNYLVASSWHFTLFHEEDARSNNPQGSKAVFGHRVVMSEQLPNFSWTEDFLQDVIGGCQVRKFAGKTAVLRDTVLFT